ncbi:hypothetical protein EV184_10285 [Sinorhizobium americanum]|uniref:Uncharacterized protein n=1 Tax=Sinorhizobium americanum TaxID=194963 RepID=A0A4R2C4Z4_9HYPH|nr:hypothetical protein EV184_10285 [Sinorhizobium americanum]
MKTRNKIPTEHPSARDRLTAFAPSAALRR